MLMVNPRGQTWNVSDIARDEDGHHVQPGYWKPVDDVYRQWLVVDLDTSEVVCSTRWMWAAKLWAWLLKLHVAERVEWKDVENQRWETTHIIRS